MTVGEGGGNVRLGSVTSARAATAVAIASVALAAACGAQSSSSSRAASPAAGQRAVSESSATPAPISTTPAGPSTGRVQGQDKRVWVEGDSVLLGTVDTLPDALKGWTVHLDTVGSRRLTEAIPVLRANRAHLGAVVAIQMGNNYIPGEEGDFASQLRTAMRIMRKVQRVVWVTVAKASSSQVHIDADILRAARRYPTIRVANWAPIIAAHPGYAYDGLHLTPPGRVAMARLIARKIGPPPGESTRDFRRHLRATSDPD